MSLGREIALAAALALGMAQFVSPKGTPWHRTLGYGWIYLGTGLALAAYVGGDARGRAIAIAMFVLIPLSLLLAQRGHMRAHAAAMISLFLLLAVSGAMALLAAPH